jgi:hypothetical protein
MNRASFVLVGLLALTLGMFVSHSVYRTLQSKTAAANPIYVVVAANYMSGRED